MIDVTPFLKLGKFKSFNENETLFMQDDLGSNMYIVVKGTFGVYVNTFTGFPTRLVGLTEGAYFGEMTVIDGSPRSATIVSEGRSSAIVIEKENFSLLLEEHPDISLNILKTLSERVNSMMQKVIVKGKAVPALPKTLTEPKHISTSADIENMTALARILRELNKILSSGKLHSPIEQKKAADIVTLLPKWHFPFKDEKIGGWGNAMMLESRDCTCAYCGNKFKWMIPSFSRLKEKNVTLDQRVIYDKFNILLYTNIICPNCNYCDTYHEFTQQQEPIQHQRVTGNQFVNTEKFTGFAHEIQRTPEDVARSFYLNLKCLEQVPGSSLRKAQTWQRLFWMYDDYQMKDEAISASKEAINHYKNYLSDDNDDISEENYMAINLILGELHVYNDAIEEACKYLAENTTIEGFTDHSLALKSSSRLKSLRGEEQTEDTEQAEEVKQTN